MNTFVGGEVSEIFISEHSKLSMVSPYEVIKSIRKRHPKKNKYAEK